LLVHVAGAPLRHSGERGYKMKCDRCEEEKNIWTELFTVRKKDHMPDNPKQWLVCKDCYPTQLEFSEKIRGEK
jgi:hypothetical protein